MVHVTCASPLGITRGQVEIADSCAEWSAVFAQIEAELRPALAEFAATVEHVGSTSVPGLAAKPVIDVSGHLR